MILKRQKLCFNVRDTCIWDSCAIKLWKRHLRLILVNKKVRQHLIRTVYPNIAKKGEFYDEFSDRQKEFIDQIEPLNIEARYPSHKERLLKSLTDTKCLEIIEETKNLQQWIKERL